MNPLESLNVTRDGETAEDAKHAEGGSLTASFRSSTHPKRNSREKAQKAQEMRAFAPLALFCGCRDFVLSCGLFHWLKTTAWRLIRTDSGGVVSVKVFILWIILGAVCSVLVFGNQIGGVFVRAIPPCTLGRPVPK